MTENIAHGQIQIDLNDADVVAGLRKVDAEFGRTMDKIARERAVAEINADLAPLSDKVEKAKRKIRELQGQKASARVDANTSELTRKIKNAERELKRLDGRKATLEIELKGAEKALAAEAALEAADNKRAKAAEQAGKRIEDSLRRETAARDREARENLARVNNAARVSKSLADQQAREEAANLRQVNERARVSSSLERQRINELRSSESAAYRMDAAYKKAAYDRDVGSRREVTQVLNLQKQYARLTDQLERLNSKKPIGREARAKVELDATGVVAKMELLKAELNALGAHPPVDIKADINQKGLKRITQGFGSFVTNIANKASGLQDLSVRLGPFTSSLRGVGLALGFLGPTITDLVGAAGSLVGVLGAGISGAAALGSGAIVGLAGDFLGLKFATRNTGQELTVARAAINSYQKAVLQYGKGSTQAVAKQQQMNSVLKQVSPLAREAALGTEKFFTAWDKSTKPTQGNLGTIAKQGFEALNKLRPMWAAATNEMSGELQRSLSGAFTFLGRGSTSNLLGGIFHNINAQIPTLLHGLGSLAQAFLNLASEGAHNFGSLASGFDHFATSILHFTQQDSFGATVRRWVTDAGDVMRFFGAATRVLVHFFGDGSQAGDRFINTMTAALNRWDRFITSASGKNQIGEFFQHSVSGAEALYSAFKPIVQLFALWSVGLEPAVTVITQIFAGLTNAASALGRFVGLGNPLKTMGATFGALFAVSKIGSFVSMLARASSILNDMRKAGGVAGVLKGIGSGGFLQQLGSGKGIAAAGETAAIAMREGIITGAAAGAAEFRAALATGGAIGGVEGAAGGGIVGAAKKLILPAGAAAEMGAAEETAVGLGAAIAGVGLGTALAATGVGALAAGLIYLGTRIHEPKSEVDKLNDSLKNNAKTLQGDASYTRSTADAQDRATAARRTTLASVKQLKTELAGLTKGTVEYRNKQIDLYAAQAKARTQADNGVAAARKTHDAAQQSIDDENKRIKLIKDRLAAANKANDQGSYNFDGTKRGADPKAEAQATAALTAEQRKLDAAYNARAASALNVGRAEKGMAAIAGKAAQQLGSLARQSATGSKLASTISLKYANPTNAGEVAAQAKNALGSGIKVKTVMQIVADSSDADAAIRRLKTVTFAKKMQQVGITGHDGVLSMLSKIDRKAIRQKIANIIQHGGQPTIDMIDKIIGRHLADKNFRISADGRQALIEVELIAAHVDSLHDKTIGIHMKTYGTGGGGSGNSGAMGAGGTATGSGPKGRRWNSLIGEGGGPEWRVDTRSGQAYKTTGPQFAALGPHDAVIPTEPKYRQNARGIMTDIARDLGMKMYARSKKPKRKAQPAHSPTTPGVPGNRAGLTKLGVPDPYKAGAVPLEDVTAAVARIDASLSTEVARKKALQKQLATLKIPKATHYTSGKRKGHVSNQTSIDAAKTRKSRMEAEVKALDRGGSRKHLWNWKPIKDLQVDKAAAHKDLNDLKTANATIDHLNSVIAQDATRMGTDTTNYNTEAAKPTPNQAVLNALVGDWTTNRNDRLGAISKLGGILDTAHTTAATLSKKFPKALNLAALTDSLSEQIGSNDAAAADTLSTDAPNANPTTLDMAGLMAQTGLTARYNQALADVAVARINNDSTPASLSDDKIASAEMVSVLKDSYAAASATGNNPLIAEVADAYSSALSDQQSLNDPGGAAAAPGPTQGQLYETGRTNLLRDFASNIYGSGVGSIAGASAGSGFMGGASAAALMPDTAQSASQPSSGPSKTVNVTNNYAAPPPDPHSWSQGVAFELGV